MRKNKDRKLVFISLTSLFLTFLFLFYQIPPDSVQASDTPYPTSVTIVGNFQSELAGSDWDPANVITDLTYDAFDNIWKGTFTIPAGNWEYKVALNHAFTENYGIHATRDGANIYFNLSTSTSVKFYYDHETHWVTDNQNSVIATVPGSFQSEIGCPGDWMPESLRSWLEDPDGDGIYRFSAVIPAGNYEAKVAINESWSENYGAEGVQNGSNIPFSLPAELRVYFTYDPTAHLLDITYPPYPEFLWGFTVEDDITDLAVGDLNGDREEDVAAIDIPPTDLTLNVIKGNGQFYWDKHMDGYSVAVGDIDGDDVNEVIASGVDQNGSGGNVINAYENDGTLKWSYYTSGIVKDIEISNIDGDDHCINEVIACNNISSPGKIYVINGTNGQDVDGWPFFTELEVIDIAVGQLDGLSGTDIAMIGEGLISALDSAAVPLWSHVSYGRTVEIGDIDGDQYNEVVSGNQEGYVTAYNGKTGTQLFQFEGGVSPVTDVQLGDLDGNVSNGKEVACIYAGEPTPDTLYALDLDNLTAPEMWHYDISWDTYYFGESIAIGDVDRDYKNEVVACSSVDFHRVYAFDGLDNNGDGIGDLVWSPYVVTSSQTDPKITDLEIGDLDGDGDKDVVFGTVSRGLDLYNILAITAVESSTVTATGTGTAYFDSDPSSLEELQPVDENTLPSEGKPDYDYPHGFFSFKIAGLDPGKTAVVTVTLPKKAPIGTHWVQYVNGNWYVLPVGDDDGDNIISFNIQDGSYLDGDGTINGTIEDPGAPAYPSRHTGVGGQVQHVNIIKIIEPYLALVFILIISGIILFFRQRKRI